MTRATSLLSMATTTGSRSLTLVLAGMCPVGHKSLLAPRERLGNPANVGAGIPSGRGGTTVPVSDRVSQARHANEQGESRSAFVTRGTAARVENAIQEKSA